MKGFRVIILFLMLAALLSAACNLFTLGVTATATPVGGQTAVALVQTIQALSTQKALLLPTNTPQPSNTPTPTQTSTPTLTPTLTQTPTNTPTAIPTAPPYIAQSFVNGYGYGYPYYGYPGNRYPYNRFPSNRRYPVIPGNNQTCNRASFVADVTIPDGTVFGPGDSFVKTWQLANAGSCTWNSNYKLVFSSGSLLSAPSSVNLPGSVAPSQTVDVSVSMVAPSSDGTYTGYWELESDTGTVFGIGTYGNSPFYVEIVVE
jgi:hypothetical protein